jgi:alpha-L-fucosidase 2
MAAMILHAEDSPFDSGFKLTFDKPATKWTEAVPLGNDRIGAMEFGGTEDERIQINESTLWGGSPHNYTRSSSLHWLRCCPNLHWQR